MNVAVVALAVFQSVVALVAIYFAYLTVRQGRIASENLRRETELRALRDVISVVADLRLALMNMNGIVAPPLRAQLAATLSLISWELPKVRELAQLDLDSATDFVEAQGVAEGALRELEHAAQPWSAVTSLDPT